jgi:hypothetical protein
VSCESDLVCAAVGAGAGSATTIYTTDGGTTWSTASVPPFDFAALGLACSSASCVAAGEAVYVSTNGGASWTTKAINGGTQGLEAVSCTAATTCIAVGTNALGISQPTATGADVVSTDGGNTWTNESTSLPASTATLQAISCAGTSSCVAVGPPESTGGPFVVAATTNGGTTWTGGGTGPSGLTYAQSIPLLGISCSSATTCIVVAGNSTGPVAYTTTNDGQTWTKDTVQQT